MGFGRTERAEDEEGEDGEVEEHRGLVDDVAKKEMDGREEVGRSDEDGMNVNEKNE